MDFCVIGGKEYNVIVVGISEGFEKLYSEDTGRTMGAGALMNLSCLGTFYSHTVKFARKQGYETDFDDLYDVLSAPSNDGIPVRIVHRQSSLDYNAYVSKGKRDVKRIDEASGKVYWDNLEVVFTPMEAQRHGEIVYD